MYYIPRGVLRQPPLPQCSWPRQQLGWTRRKVKGMLCKIHTVSVVDKEDEKAIHAGKTETASTSSTQEFRAGHLSSMMIFASEVPVIAALNPYRSIDEIFTNVWRRTDPTQIQALEETYHVRLEVPAERMEKIIEHVGMKDTLVSFEKLGRQAHTIGEVHDMRKDMKKQVETELKSKDISPKVIQEVVEHIQSTIHKNFGIQHEATAVKDLEETRLVKVSDQNLQFFKRQIGEIDHRKVFIGGRIDGKMGGQVIEIKNRMRRFISPLPKYDVAQLQTYLQILDGTDGELVEHLRHSNHPQVHANGIKHATKVVESSSSSSTKSTHVPRDDKMWQQDILPHLTSFAHSLHAFMKDSEAQKNFLMENQNVKKDIIRSFWMNSPGAM